MCDTPSRSADSGGVTGRERLPSNLEDFWMMPPNLPHGVYVPGKATRLLGWEPRHTLEAYTHRPSRL